MKMIVRERRVRARTSNCQSVEGWNELRTHDTNGEKMTRTWVFAIDAQWKWETQTIVA